MKADGSDRLCAWPLRQTHVVARRPTTHDHKLRSPRAYIDGREPAEERSTPASDHHIHSKPSWAGEETIVAVIGLAEGDTIALIDVSDPQQARVKEVLWQRAIGPNVNPSYPIFSAATSRCVLFAGEDAKGMAHLSVQQGKPWSPNRLGHAGYDPQITDLASSPDGRYVLYCVHGPDRSHGGIASGGQTLPKRIRGLRPP